MRRLAYGLIGVVVLAAAGFMIFRALSDSLVYFVLPNEYARDPGEYADRRLRLGGIVEEGSVAFDSNRLQLTFLVTDSIESFEVQHRGSPPDLFKENGGVVVEGRFKGGIFVSDNVLVKHSEVYQAPEPGEPIDVEALKNSLQ